MADRIDIAAILALAIARAEQLDGVGIALRHAAELVEGAAPPACATGEDWAHSAAALRGAAGVAMDQAQRLLEAAAFFETLASVSRHVAEEGSTS